MKNATEGVGRTNAKFDRCLCVLVGRKVANPHPFLAEKAFGFGCSIDLARLRRSLGEWFLAENVLACRDGHQHVCVMIGGLCTNVNNVDPRVRAQLLV